MCIYIYIYIYCYKIHQYLVQAILNALRPLAKRPCINYRELSNFILEVSCSF